MTRAEHVQWCKDRALAYVDEGDLSEAVASMISDMNKHEYYEVPTILTQLGMMELMNRNKDGVRRWIEGFN